MLASDEFRMKPTRRNSSPYYIQVINKGVVFHDDVFIQRGLYFTAPLIMGYASDTSSISYYSKGTNFVLLTFPIAVRNSDGVILML